MIAGQTACSAGKKNGLVDSMDVRTRESDRGRFGCLPCQQIGRPTHVTAGLFAGKTSSKKNQPPFDFHSNTSETIKLQKMERVHMLWWLTARIAELKCTKKNGRFIIAEVHTYSKGQGWALLVGRVARFTI